jgi:hypothetical protein
MVLLTAFASFENGASQLHLLPLGTTIGTSFDSTDQEFRVPHRREFSVTLPWPQPVLPTQSAWRLDAISKWAFFGSGYRKVPRISAVLAILTGGSKHSAHVVRRIHPRLS